MGVGQFCCHSVHNCLPFSSGVSLLHFHLPSSLPLPPLVCQWSNAHFQVPGESVEECGCSSYLFAISSHMFWVRSLVLSLHENDNLGLPEGKESHFEGEKSCGYLPEGRSNRLLQDDCERDALKVVDEWLKNSMKRWSLAVSLGLMRGKWALI